MPLSRNTALATGALVLGALGARAALRQRRRPAPAALPPALEADVRVMDVMEGQARYYVRPGSGVPIVLLHSLNAAASSFEMRPLFDHLAGRTDRPLYALDWLGFGLSDRPRAAYRPSLYQRQLRRFLSEHVDGPADVVALSLGCEYAAAVAVAFPQLVRQLALVMPTAVAADDEGSPFQRVAVGALGGLGLFSLAFRPLTAKKTLRWFYARQVFPENHPVPDALVDYARATTQAEGAPNAPRYFVQGALFMRDEARRAYQRLEVPTLLLAPRESGSKVQSFERLPEIVADGGARLRVQRLSTGLLPQWESDSGAFFQALDDFLLQQQPEQA